MRLFSSGLGNYHEGPILAVDRLSRSRSGGPLWAHKRLLTSKSGGLLWRIYW